MSKGFSINDILGNTKANAPAGQKMQVVMLPEADIEPNPENSIYEIGDVSMLKADIAERAESWQHYSRCCRLCGWKKVLRRDLCYPRS